jgi:hypothetical protein
MRMTDIIYAVWMRRKIYKRNTKEAVEEPESKEK